MTHSTPKLLLSALLLCLFILGGCTHMRTEFYRNETQYLYETACTDYSQGDYTAARARLMELIGLDPDYGPAYAVLGNLAMIEEAYETANVWYKKAMEHDPELESDILPFLLVSEMHKIRKPLTDKGIELSLVYPLMMEEKLGELEQLLAQDLELDLLARDSVSITPGQLADLRVKAEELAPIVHNYPTLRLFTAYLLFHGDGDISVIDTLLADRTSDEDTARRQGKYILMGRLQEKEGNNAAAVSNYLAAVQAGAAMEAVAHYLARIYRVDVAEILSTLDNKQAEDEIVAAGKSEREASLVRSNSKPMQTIPVDETNFQLPAPRAVLMSSPQ